MVAMRGRALALGIGGLLGLWAAPALSGVLRLQDGLSPDAGYFGTRDVKLAWQDDPVSDPDANYDLVEDELDGFPAKKSVLIRWDLGALTPGTPIVAGWFVFDTQSTTGHSYGVYEALQPWVASEANWWQYAAGSPWADAGAQWVGADRGSVKVAVIGPAADAGLTTFPLLDAGVALVQRWVDLPGTNLGFIIQDYSGTNGYDFTNSESPALASRPLLRVQYDGGAIAEFQNGISPSPSYAGTADTTIAMAPPPWLVNSNVEDLEAVGGSSLTTSILSFDLSPVPADASVTAAQLEFTVTDTSTGDFPIYELLRPWTETGASYWTTDGTTLWEDAGATGPSDHGAVELARFSPADAGRISVPLNDAGIAVVQAWIDGSRPNDGFLIWNPATTDDVGLTRRESSTASKRPALVLTYVILPADAGAPDGGADAGADAGSDAGQGGPDAGADGGEDAGADAGLDAGADAGPPRTLWVTCGCGSAPGGALAVALLALILTRSGNGGSRRPS